MVHGENRIPYWIDWRLSGLAGPDYDATISFGLPIELGDCPYGKSRLIGELSPKHTYSAPGMKHDLQRSALRWLSVLAASVVGAYKFREVIDLVVTAIR